MPDLEFVLLHGTPTTIKLMKSLSRYLVIMKTCTKQRMRRLTENGFEPQFSPDITHLCRGMGLRIPSLPVRTKEEFPLFSILMLNAEMDRFDGEKMALLWVKYLDGALVVPKLPAHLKEYHKSWETNECIKAAMERTQNDDAILQRYLDRMVPDEFGTGGSDHLEQEENPRKAMTQITTDQNVQMPAGQTRNSANLMGCYPQEHAHVWWRQHPLYGYSHPLNLPNGATRALPDTMRRDTEVGNVVVNGYAIVAGHGLPSTQQISSERRRRHCKLCHQASDRKRIEYAHLCSGRCGARFCVWSMEM
jgi:hypothetical protein